MIEDIVLAHRAGKFEIRWNERHGSVISNLSGAWDAADGAAFQPAITAAADQSRARNGRALFLFDITNTQFQPALIQRHDELPIILGDDRAAVVVASSLVKLQMKQARPAGRDRAFFVARSAAETWLYAYEGIG